MKQYMQQRHMRQQECRMQKNIASGRKTIIPIQKSIWTPSKHWKPNHSTNTKPLKQTENAIRKIKMRMCVQQSQNKKTERHIVGSNPAQTQPPHITNMQTRSSITSIPYSKKSQKTSVNVTQHMLHVQRTNAITTYNSESTLFYFKLNKLIVLL